jgi:serine protease AprX
MVDPLAFAVENAWKHGIVVVAAGGNDGETSKTLADPASDPHVVAVGAMDDAGTVAATDDTVPAWSTHGTAARHVDVVAPGVSLLGLRVPGGTADAANPQARVGDRFARASGTSQAAAVVSGEVALLLQANPTLSPDQVKALLQGNAARVTHSSTTMSGSGQTDLRKVFEQLLKLAPIPAAPAASWGNGSGSIEAARGSAHVAAGDAVLSGEVDVFGVPWNGAQWAKEDGDKHAWKNGTWRGETLTGKGWRDSGHGRKSWPTTTWTLTTADGVVSSDWTARMWRDDAWTARMWRDDSWSARMWREQSWS